MNENKYIEVKEDLKSIINAAFYDFDDYVTDCHESGIDVTEDVEDFVADAIIKAGYVKQGATDTNDGSKSGDCENCNDHLEEIAKILWSDCGDCTECLYFHKEINGVDACYFKYAEMIYNAGYRKQSEGKWVNNHCSVCGMTPIGDEIWERLDITPPRYELFMDSCPICGARMKGGE